MSKVAPVTNVDDLLAFDGDDFIRVCYLSLLRRHVDPDGLRHHGDALRGGSDKLSIAASIAASSEASEQSLNYLPLALSVIHRKAARDKRFPWLRWRKRKIRHSQAKRGQPATTSINVPSKSDIVVGHPKHQPIWAVRSENALPPVGAFGTLWLDMTTSFEWTGGVVGILRSELELACGLRKLYPHMRYCLQIGNGFAEIEEEELRWLFEAPNVADAYMNFFGRYHGQEPSGNHINVDIPLGDDFYHPFSSGDLILAVGWIDSKKEHYYSVLKKRIPNIYLCYLIYDLILLLPQTRHLYASTGSDRFAAYLKWASYNCDFLLFGGETAKADVIAYQEKMGWPTPPGCAIQFGTDIMKSVDPEEGQKLLEGLGVTGPFIMTVGSIEPRKNHELLYRAYLMALQNAPDSLPQLIFCGKKSFRADDLMDRLERDPRIKGKLLCLTPTDKELTALYANCEYTLLPSLYEGWSLTLPESLGQGKFCICADTPPLREIGKDLVDFIDPFDVKGWADAIIYYAENPQQVVKRAHVIEKSWPTTTWGDTATMVLDALIHLAGEVPASEQATAARRLKPSEKPLIWMDLSVSFLYSEGKISGVIRAELMFAYYLHKLAPETRFFAFNGMHLFQIMPDMLSWLFDSKEIAADFRYFDEYWKQAEQSGTGHRVPFHHIQGPASNHPAYLDALPANSIVFFAAIDFLDDERPSRVRQMADLAEQSSAVLLSHIVYDFTPMLIPHCHMPATCEGYEGFFEFLSNHFDYIAYGGRTAQRDGIRIQKERGWKTPPSSFLEFGSDLNFNAEPEPSKKSAEVERLHQLGISGDFVLTVGTIEPRKNHETLYKAYLRLLQRDALNRPVQLVIVGRNGWKSDDFLATISADERVKGKILILTPPDEDLDILYRHCQFTLLPTFYEGWSLTLPESLSYGKFCITSDADPLREVGGGLVEYIDPLDPWKWAERIEFYLNNPEELRRREGLIREGWHPQTWQECTETLLESLYRAHAVLSDKIYRDEMVISA